MAMNKHSPKDRTTPEKSPPCRPTPGRPVPVGRRPVWQHLRPSRRCASYRPSGSSGNTGRLQSTTSFPRDADLSFAAHKAARREASPYHLRVLRGSTLFPHLRFQLFPVLSHPLPLRQNISKETCCHHHRLWLTETRSKRNSRRRAVPP